MPTTQSFNWQKMNNSTMSTTPARARLCCGCCCDFRRAVIIVDLVIVILEALVLISLPLGATDQVLFVPDEDLIKTEMIFSGVSIATGLLSIFGAYIFNVWPVLINVAWLLIVYIAAIIYAIQWCNDYIEKYTSKYLYATCSISPGSVIVQGILMLLWIYPHVGFIVQVAKGTLTKDGYVPSSCCCVVGNSTVAGVEQQVSPVVDTSATPSKMEQGVMQ
mmetsp:Transcript_24412/g.51165  ORF Transcript_24412/g.51165 Transcript_24412/m.51165 type:complete len:219 (+) Transcript_24412:176-832(+)